MEQPDALDDVLLRVLQERDGLVTTVVLRDGRNLPVANIAWGYDVGDEYAHVTSNCSPSIDGMPMDVFFTSEVIELLDDTGRSIAFLE